MTEPTEFKIKDRPAINYLTVMGHVPTAIKREIDKTGKSVLMYYYEETAWADWDALSRGVKCPIENYLDIVDADALFKRNLHTLYE